MAKAKNPGAREPGDALLDLVRGAHGHPTTSVALSISRLPPVDRLQLLCLCAALLVKQRPADVLRLLTGPEEVPEQDLKFPHQRAVPSGPSDGAPEGA